MPLIKRKVSLMVDALFFDKFQHLKKELMKYGYEVSFERIIDNLLEKEVEKMENILKELQKKK